jgi:hypothetical protein
MVAYDAVMALVSGACKIDPGPGYGLEVFQERRFRGATEEVFIQQNVGIAR